MAAINNATLAYAAKELDRAMTTHMESEFRSRTDYSMASDLTQIVKTHALGAAASGVGVAWLPGVGGVAAMAAMVGFIWSMYFRINNRLGLKFSKVLVKSLASAVMSNLAQSALSVVGTVAISTVLSMTGVGNGLSSVLMAALDCSVVLVGGILYLKLLTGLFFAGKKPGEMNEREIKVAMEDVMAGENVSSLLKQAKKEYTAGRKDGTITGKETVETVEA